LTLKNTDPRRFATDIFGQLFLFNGQPTRSGKTIRFPFKPQPQALLGDAVAIGGDNMTYKEELQPKAVHSGSLNGHSVSAADYYFTVEDTKNKVDIEQSSALPTSPLYLWPLHSMISPEVHIHLDVASGKTSH
jgi:hypothetical protein